MAKNTELKIEANQGRLFFTSALTHLVAKNIGPGMTEEEHESHFQYCEGLAAAIVESAFGAFPMQEKEPGKS